MEDKELKMVLLAYIAEVTLVCNNLLQNINEKEGLNLITKMDFFMYHRHEYKMEFEANGLAYQLHGIGCMVHNDNYFIDWDFGTKSRWCGIDPWKVALTLQKNNAIYGKIHTSDVIKEACDKWVQEGVMFKHNVQYYFTIPINETFMPSFPKEYDTLVIENPNFKQTVLRNKLIDRFIRKSQRVYSKIDTCPDVYVLKFLLNSKEVYAILYSDIGYPESAVRIMTNEILILT